MMWAESQRKERAMESRPRTPSDASVVSPTPAPTVPQRATVSPDLEHRFRVRLRYRKGELLRYLGHHDMVTLLERLFRRAELPINQSLGFHPKPRISIPIALALGVVGEEEVVELELGRPIGAAALLDRLNQETAPGLEWRSAEELDFHDRQSVCRLEYRVSLPETVDRPALLRRIEEFARASRWPVERALPGKPVKEIDLRAFVAEARVEGDQLHVACAVRDGATARPEEILKALDLSHLPGEGVYLVRSRVVLAPRSKAARPTSEEPSNDIGEIEEPESPDC